MSYELRVNYKLQVTSYKLKILFISFLASCFLLLASDVFAVTIDERYKPLYDELSDKFICLCGCGSTIKTCPHEECGFAIPFRKELAERIQKGETKEQLIKYFVDKHGEKILSSPAKKGFNLMAWIMPFAVIIIAGFLIKKVINKWVKEQKAEDRRQKTDVVEDKYKKMLKKELEELE